MRIFTFTFKFVNFVLSRPALASID